VATVGVVPGAGRGIGFVFVRRMSTWLMCPLSSTGQVQDIEGGVNVSDGSAAPTIDSVEFLDQANLNAP
jgi:hypothetical protein